MRYHCRRQGVDTRDAAVDVENVEDGEKSGEESRFHFWLCSSVMRACSLEDSSSVVTKTELWHTVLFWMKCRGVTVSGYNRAPLNTTDYTTNSPPYLAPTQRHSFHDI